MIEEEEDKVSLSRKRAELIEVLAATTLPTELIRIQGELRVINAKIKAINTTAAAQLKAAADRRKVTGLAEFQAHTARALGKVNSGMPQNNAAPDLEVDDDPGQTGVIDGWIDAVLLRNDVEFTRSRAGKITIDVTSKWTGVISTLIDGIYAAARGQELPDLPSAPPKIPKTTKSPKTATPRKRP